MNLTELEKDVIVAIAENQYADRPGDPVWSFAISYHTKITKPEQMGGVVSSLIKKGLVECSGRDKDAAIELTDAGIKIYHGLKGDRA